MDYTTVSGAGAVNCGHGAKNYVWSPMADLRDNTVRVRVSYTDYASINIESAHFTVKPKIAVTLNPSGVNTKLKVGSSYTNLVQWTYSGTTTSRNVEVRYSVNGGTDGYPGNQVIAATATAGSGATGVSWNTVPNIIGTNVTVKVFDKDFTAAAGESVPLKVHGGISAVAPSGAAVNRSADTTMNVTWNYAGSITNFNVYYSANSGGAWAKIGDNLAVGTVCTGANCTYSWMKPSRVIRIRYSIPHGYV